MNKFGKFLLCLSIPALMASTGCAIYYGIEYHNLDKQVIEDDSGMVNVVDELRKSVASLETEKANLTQQLTLLQEQYDALNQLRQNLENTNNTLETENAELQTQIDELNTQNEQLEIQITNLNNQITSLNTQIETLNKTLEDNKSASDEEIASLQVQVTTLQAQVNSLNSTIDNLNNEIDSYEANTIALNTEIANLNNTIDEYEQEIENYKRIIEELKKINSCVVTFIVDGQVVSTQQVNKTESPVAIDTPTSESYIFDGWTISGSTEIVDPFTYSVVEDMEFVASIRKYKVITFTIDDEVVSTQSIITDSELQLPDEPTKEHYAFLGWSIDGENIIDLTSYSFIQDTNLIAVFEVVGQLAYTFDGNTLTSYTGNDTEVVIPSSYSILEEGIFVEGNDYQVTNIGVNAFKNNTTLNSIVFSENIISIGDYAFAGCKQLTSLDIPNSINTIGNYAFGDCSNLLDITVGENVTSIGKCAFSGCSNLRAFYYNAINASIKDTVGIFRDKNTSGYTDVSNDLIVYVGNKVFAIPDKLFYCEDVSYDFHLGLKQVVFEENSVCENIGSMTFYNCYTLSEINIPNSIALIEENAFYNCPNSLFTVVDNVKYLGNDDNLYLCLYKSSLTTITEFTIPDGCKVICDSAFYECTSLKSAILPDTIEYIGKNAFYNCNRITTLVLSENLVKIGESAFNNCTRINSLTIPNSVQYIDKFAFCRTGIYNSVLKTITIGSGVSYIGEGAFYISGLTTVNYVGSEEQWNLIEIGSTNDYLTGVTINYNYIEE